jgi:hypothetical protein
VVSPLLQTPLPHVPQSCGQLTGVSPLPQTPLPQVFCVPQSCGHEEEVSPLLQTLSPQYWFGPELHVVPLHPCEHNV